jgi:hypothetical protein
MKAEAVSRDLVPKDLIVRRLEGTEKKSEDFRVLLDASTSTSTHVSPFQESLPCPLCPSDYADGLSFYAKGSSKIGAVYQMDAALCRSSQSENGLPTGEDSLLNNLRTAGPSGSGLEEISVRPGLGDSSQPESTDGLTRVLSGIKSFFVRIFSPEESATSKTETIARSEPTTQEVGETESNQPAARFFRQLGTLLTFGLWRPDESSESGRASEQTLAKASDARDVLIEKYSQANGSSRQNLPGEKNVGADQPGEASVASEIGGKTGSMKLKIPEKIQEAIHEAALKYDLSPDLIAAVIKVESNFDAGATSREGAGGLMQLMPATARRLEVRDRFDIRENIDAGCRYLKALLARFDGQLELALAAYNVGPEAVERYNGVPPYRQTQHYVRKVMAYC